MWPTALGFKQRSHRLSANSDTVRGLFKHLRVRVGLEWQLTR